MAVDTMPPWVNEYNHASYCSTGPWDVTESTECHSTRNGMAGPRDRGPDRMAGRRQASPGRTPAPHFLIVDDDLTTLKLLEKALAGLGEMHTATRGAQALEQGELRTGFLHIADAFPYQILDPCRPLGD